MIFKLAIVLLAVVALCHAGSTPGLFIFHTFADENCNTTLIASFVTSDNSLCWTKKRDVAQKGLCDTTFAAQGLYAVFDYSSCYNTTLPEIPASFQAVQLTTDSSCNRTAGVFSYLVVPNPIATPTPVAIYYSSQVLVANTTLTCDTTSGNMTAIACLGGEACISFNNLQTSVCSVDGSLGTNYGFQTTCVAAPVAAPVATPVAGPVAAPVAAPATTPTKTPSKTPTKASSASVAVGSAALLLVAALF